MHSYRLSSDFWKDEFLFDIFFLPEYFFNVSSRVDIGNKFGEGAFLCL